VTFFGIFPTPGIFLCDHENFWPDTKEEKAKLKLSIEYGKKMSWRSAGVRRGLKGSYLQLPRRPN